MTVIASFVFFKAVLESVSLSLVQVSYGPAELFKSILDFRLFLLKLSHLTLILVFAGFVNKVMD